MMLNAGQLIIRSKHLRYSHLWFGNTPLGPSLFPRTQTCHQDRLCSSAGASACAPNWSIEHRENHGHDLGLHLPHSREHIRMYGVRHGEFIISIALKGSQILPSVIYSPRHESIFPSGVLHLFQLLQLRSDLIWCPSLDRQPRVAIHSGSVHGELLLDIFRGILDFFLDPLSDSWK